MIRHASLRLVLVLVLLLVGTSVPLFAEMPTPAPADPLFQDRPYGPRPETTPTPLSRTIDLENEKPIPLSWIIGGASAAFFAAALLLYGSARRWRSSNLFDRQYHFPVLSDPSLRFGAKKCGGHLAQVHFGSAVIPSAPSSKNKDT